MLTKLRLVTTDTISSCGLYETEERLARRENVLKRLQQVLQEYALHEALEHGSEDEAASKRLQLRTFGSYRLGVQSTEADIDTYGQGNQLPVDLCHNY